MKKIRVLLGDLGHMTKRLPNNFVPLNIGYIGASLEQAFDGEVCVGLYKDAFRLLEVIHELRPKVLTLSNYVWNRNLSLYVMRVYKQICQEGIGVIGGPNLPFEEDRLKKWLVDNPVVDFVVPGEGERSLCSKIICVSD
jgi:hypothetical protein